MRRAVKIELTDAERKILTKWSRGRMTVARLVQRAQIILLAADGKANGEIARALKIARGTVGTWRQRFVANRFAGIEKDLPRGGRKPTERERVAELIITKTTQEKPSNATHWSTRTLAEEIGVSRSMVHRIWQANGLKPHLIRTFKVSKDPDFVDKLIDVVGLYLNPPDHALVLAVDEKGQVQALDRTQPSLPLYPGRLGTMTHDYKRHGTTTLFAALDMASGKIVAECMPRHRHQEWIKFLKLIDRSTEPTLELHLIADNYATHKHPKVKAWLKRHPRFHMHFTPTSSSWLNMVERWFREITTKRIRRGSFRNVPELINAIMEYVEHHNQTAKPFVWKAKAETILQKYRRAKAVLDKIKTA
ncbi:MAG: IS630 family transposase [bacterium]